MKVSALLALAAVGRASVIPHIPDVGEVVADVVELVDLWMHGNERITVTQGWNERLGGIGGICTLTATDEGEDDTDNIEEVFERCGKNGIIMMPSEKYNITRPLKVHLRNAVVSLKGWLSFSSDNLDYWIENSFDLGFQNQKLAFIIEGENFVLDGNNKGGIDGNGQAWYTFSKGVGNVHGRPMSMALMNVKNAVVKNWSIIQPQFWAHILVDSENVSYHNCYVNATSYDDNAPFSEKSWLQNTDGIDTYRSKNVAITNFVYQGGDDCIAFKPNSTNIAVHNATCVGGTGIAFGSIAQYEGVTDIIENVALHDIKLYPSNQCRGFQGIYFKSWIGEAAGQPPNGGGGGTGWCKNVSIHDIYMEDIDRPIALTAGLTYLDDEIGKHKMGTFEWSHINFTNVYAKATANRALWLNCSPAQPCHDWRFKNVTLISGKDDHPEIQHVCNNFKHHHHDHIKCHPNNSTLESETGGTM